MRIPGNHFACLTLTQTQQQQIDVYFHLGETEKETQIRLEI